MCMQVLQSNGPRLARLTKKEGARQSAQIQNGRDVDFHIAALVGLEEGEA